MATACFARVGDYSEVAEPARVLRRETVREAENQSKLEANVALTWWQVALNLMVNVLVAAGAAGLLVAGWRALRGPKRTSRSPKALALASTGALAIGATTGWFSRELRQPRQSFVSTPEHFSSDAFGVTLDAPRGWRLEHDGAVLTAIRGAAPADQSPVSFVLTSSALDKEAPLEAVLEPFKQALKQQGLTVNASFQESVAGHSADGFLAAGERAQFSNWMLKRGPRWVLLIQCFTRDGSDPRSACKEAIDGLSLRPPTDPKGSQ